MSTGGGGNQLLALEFSEIDLFLLHLTCGGGHTVPAQTPVSHQIIRPQSKISTLELSPFGCACH